jgi:hypothetical protein
MRTPTFPVRRSHARARRAGTGRPEAAQVITKTTDPSTGGDANTHDLPRVDRDHPSGPGRANGAASAGHRGGEINDEQPHPSAPPRGGAHDLRRDLHRPGVMAFDAGPRCDAALFDRHHRLRRPLAERPPPGPSPDPMQCTALARFGWTGQGRPRSPVRIQVPAEGLQPGRLRGDLPASDKVLATSGDVVRIPPLVRLQRSCQRHGLDPDGPPMGMGRLVLRLRTQPS